ncbi:MAG: DNA polymerase III subunit delta [Lachnospiraceae bacterium]|nr:DNA polymerase III subunit delta [Lachnospiraceae bacterium]
MKTIREHIKNGSFAPCYLLYGKEKYLIQLTEGKLVDALTEEGDSMNFNQYRNSGIDVTEVRSVADTVPFFAEKRLILVKDSGWFKGKCELASYIPEMPETTVILFVESDVDKSSELYAAVKEHGYVCEINGMSEEDLRLFIGSFFKKQGLGITASDADFLTERVGTDMNRLTTEMEKLSAYCEGTGVVRREDILRIASPIPEGQIFAMMDAIVNDDRSKAIALYTELLAAQEKPLRILYMLTNNFYSFYKVLCLADIGISADEIASRLGMRPFAVKKFMRRKKSWSFSKVLQAVEDGNDMERRVKSGDLEEHMAVESFLFRYTTEVG